MYALINTKTKTLVSLEVGMGGEMNFDWSQDEFLDEIADLWVGRTAVEGAALYVTHSRDNAELVRDLLNENYESVIFGKMQTFEVVEYKMVTVH